MNSSNIYSFDFASGKRLRAACERGAEALDMAEIYVATGPTSQFDAEVQIRATTFVQKVRAELYAIVKAGGTQ